MFSHLHTHSCFSFLEGLASPEELARAAASAGMPALALTDHISLTGALPFYRACRSAGVKPILGLEVDLLLPYRLSTSPQPSTTGSLVLLAQDESGWKNISTISSMLLTRPEGLPSYLSLDLLGSFNTNLICLTGGCRGVLQRLISQTDGVQVARNMLDSLREIFGARLYVEINSQQPSDIEVNNCSLD